MDDGSGKKGTVDPGEIDYWQIFFVDDDGDGNFIAVIYREDPSRCLDKVLVHWETGEKKSLVKNVLLKKVTNLDLDNRSSRKA